MQPAFRKLFNGVSALESPAARQAVCCAVTFAEGKCGKDRRNGVWGKHPPPRNIIMSFGQK
jgi:hypothetical protein